MPNWEDREKPKTKTVEKGDMKSFKKQARKFGMEVKDPEAEKREATEKEWRDLKDLSSNKTSKDSLYGNKSLKENMKAYEDKMMRKLAPELFPPEDKQIQ